MPGNGYAPNSTVQLSQEPVAIIAVDTRTRMAQGLTRVRVVVNIDCTYPLGGVYVLPAVGDQWYIERLNDRYWKLVTRIPFNDDNTLIEAVPGQMVIGGTGPVVVNGSSLDVRGDTSIDGTLGVGDVILKDIDGQLKQSTDGGDTFTSVGGSETGVEGSVNGVPTKLELWTGTQVQYDAIPMPRDPLTVFVVVPP